MMDPAKCMPETVTVTGDRGVYEVASRSRFTVKHKVDVESPDGPVCTCESYIKGKAYEMRKKFGVCNRSFCHHIKDALEAHAILLIAGLRKGQDDGA